MKKIIFAPIFFLCVVAIAQEFVPPISPDDDFVARPLDEIEQLLRDEKYEIVIAECEKLIAYDAHRPESKFAMLILADAYRKIGEIEKADKILEIAETSTNPRLRAEMLAWQFHSLIESDQPNHDKIEKIADQFATQFLDAPHTPEILSRIAQHLIETDQLTSARKWLEIMIKNYPNQDPTIHATLRMIEKLAEIKREGDLFFDHELAIKILETIEKNNPDRPEIAIMKSRFYAETDLPDLALKTFDDAIRISPMHHAMVHAWLMKGVILHDHFRDAIRAIKALKIASDFRGTHESREAARRLAEIYRELGEIEKAIDLLDQIASGKFPDPFVVEALLTKSELHTQNGAFDLAEATLKDLIEKFPHTQHAQHAKFRLLELYFQTKQNEQISLFLTYLLTAETDLQIQLEAVRRIDEFGERFNEDLDFPIDLNEIAKMLFDDAKSDENYPIGKLIILSKIAEISEDPEVSIFANQKLLDRSSDLLIQFEARNRLAEAFRRNGDFESSITHLEKILEISPDGFHAPELMLRLAEFQFNRDRKDSDGWEILRQLIDKFPNSEEAREAERWIGDRDR